MKPETKFRTNKVRPFLKGLEHCKAFPIQQMAIKDDPDYLLCIRGKFVALELKKSSKDKPRPLQEKKLREVLDAGGWALTACPENWDKIKSVLQTLNDGGDNVVQNQI